MKQKVRRKVITKHVHRDLTGPQAREQFLKGMHQATSIALNIYANKLQLKELAEQFESSFKYRHPTHPWHVEGQAYEPELPDTVAENFSEQTNVVTGTLLEEVKKEEQ